MSKSLYKKSPERWKVRTPLQKTTSSFQVKINSYKKLVGRLRLHLRLAKIQVRLFSEGMNKAIEMGLTPKDFWKAYTPRRKDVLKKEALE